MTRTQTGRQKIRDEHRDSWVAVDEGDRLIGKVVDVTDAWSDKRNGLKGGFYPLLTIDVEEATGYDPKPDELKVHCFGTVLFNEAMRKRPEVGERVRILYRGQGEDKRGTGNPPELYSLTVAGRKDAGARAYDSIDRTEGRSDQRAAAVAPDVPIDHPEQGTLDVDDDDIPF
jgi:hypothetical protein